MNFENLKELTKADVGKTTIDLKSGDILVWNGERWVELNDFIVTPIDMKLVDIVYERQARNAIRKVNHF